MYILYISIQGHVKRFCIQDKKPFHFFFSNDNHRVEAYRNCISKIRFLPKRTYPLWFCFEKRLDTPLRLSHNK